MLSIRNEQMAIFQRQAERRFASDLYELLHETIIARRRESGPEDALRFVEAAIASARELRLTSDWAVANYVALACRFGEGFAKHPMVAAILSPGAAEGDARMQRLFNDLTEIDWWHVRRFTEGNADAA